MTNKAVMGALLRHRQDQPWIDFWTNREQHWKELELERAGAGKTGGKRFTGFPEEPYDTGIFWDRNRDRWQARIKHEQREFHLGSSKNKEVVVPLRHIAESFLYKKQVGTVQMSMTKGMFDLITQDQANEQYWSIGPASFSGVGTEEQLDCMNELCGKLQAVAKKANKETDAKGGPLPERVSEPKKRIFRERPLGEGEKMFGLAGPHTRNKGRVATWTPIINHNKHQYHLGSTSDRSRAVRSRLLGECFLVLKGVEPSTFQSGMLQMTEGQYNAIVNDKKNKQYWSIGGTTFVGCTEEKQREALEEFAAKVRGRRRRQEGGGGEGKKRRR